MQHHRLRVEVALERAITVRDDPPSDHSFYARSTSRVIIDLPPDLPREEAQYQTLRALDGMLSGVGFTFASDVTPAEPMEFPDLPVHDPGASPPIPATGPRVCVWRSPFHGGTMCGYPEADPVHQHVTLCDPGHAPSAGCHPFMAEAPDEAPAETPLGEQIDGGGDAVEDLPF